MRLPQAGTPFTFDASCSEVFPEGDPVSSYSWDFGDGTESTVATVAHTYDVADVYTVTLTVEDGGGGSRSLARAITVRERNDASSHPS